MKPAKNAKGKAPARLKPKEAKTDVEVRYDLRMYAAGKTPSSLQDLPNPTKTCDEPLAGKYRLQIIDLLKKPQLAAGDQILAIPTLVRTIPKPARKIIGDLSNTERVLVGLDVRPVQ